MKDNWQPLFIPAQIDQPENLPAELKEFLAYDTEKKDQEQKRLYPLALIFSPVF